MEMAIDREDFDFEVIEDFTNKFKHIIILTENNYTIIFNSKYFTKT